MSQKFICNKHDQKEIEFLHSERLEFLCSICLTNEKLNKDDVKIYLKEQFNEDLMMIEEKLSKLAKIIRENLKLIQDFRLNKLINSKEIQKFFSDSLDFFKNPIDSKFNLKFFQSLTINNLFANSSDILKSHPNSGILYDLFRSEGKEIKNITRIYKASDYLFKAAKFHEICDNKGPTLVVVQAKGSNRVFGGYANASWNSNINNFHSAPGSFLFQLDFKTKHILYDQDEDSIKYVEYAMCSYPDYNPTFGSGHDIYLSDNCNIGDKKDYLSEPKSLSCLGGTYSPPLINAIDNNILNLNNDYMTFESKEASSYLAGSNTFVVSEFEVFTISFV